MKPVERRVRRPGSRVLSATVVLTVLGEARTDRLVLGAPVTVLLGTVSWLRGDASDKSLADQAAPVLADQVW